MFSHEYFFSAFYTFFSSITVGDKNQQPLSEFRLNMIFNVTTTRQLNDAVNIIYSISIIGKKCS